MHWSKHSSNGGTASMVRKQSFVLIINPLCFWIHRPRFRNKDTLNGLLIFNDFMLLSRTKRELLIKSSICWVDLLPMFYIFWILGLVHMKFGSHSILEIDILGIFSPLYNNLLLESMIKRIFGVSQYTLGSELIVD